MRLMDAAAAIVARRGFVGASIEDIAESAGYTRGAFHANFKNKEALFLALTERTIQAAIAEIHETMEASQSPEETQKNLRVAYTCYTGKDKETFLLLTEAQLYALRNPRFGKKLAALFDAVYDELVRSVEHFQAQNKYADTTSAVQLVLIGFALGHGLVLYNLLNPQRYPDVMVSDSLKLVFDRLFPQKK
jgi:AcrR family transcriptional regulator